LVADAADDRAASRSVEGQNAKKIFEAAGDARWGGVGLLIGIP